jgi:hypothetical protein
MKEYYPFEIFGFTFVIAIPDGSDGWLWRSEFTPPKSRHTQTDLISLRIVESRQGWIGVEFVFFVFVFLLKWDAPNTTSSGQGEVRPLPLR